MKFRKLYNWFLQRMNILYKWERFCTHYEVNKNDSALRYNSYDNRIDDTALLISDIIKIKNMTKLCDIIQDTARVDTRKIYLCQVTCLNWVNRDIYPRKLFGVAGVVGVEDDVES